MLLHTMHTKMTHSIESGPHCTGVQCDGKRCWTRRTDQISGLSLFKNSASSWWNIALVNKVWSAFERRRHQPVERDSQLGLYNNADPSFFVPNHSLWPLKKDYHTDYTMMLLIPFFVPFPNHRRPFFILMLHFAFGSCYLFVLWCCHPTSVFYWWIHFAYTLYYHGSFLYLVIVVDPSLLVS